MSDAIGSRHFVEILVWVPATDTSWRLEWTLLEVVGDSVEPVARERLIDAADRDAPDRPLDLRSVVVVRNDDAGRAEWALLTGPDARSEFIPTRTELGEIRALLTIQIAPAGLRVSQPWRYRASIRFGDTEFVGPTGTRVRVSGPITITTWVGSIGGPTR